MQHPEEEHYPEKRPTFLTVLCILTFVGSGWAIFSAITAYRTAETTISSFSEPVMNKSVVNTRTKTDTLVESPRKDTFSNNQKLPDSLKDFNTTNDSMKSVDDNLDKDGVDTTTASFQMGKKLSAKMKKNVLDMMSVEKLKNSAMGSFIAALFTLAGAFFMWRLRKFGLFIYTIGIAIGIIAPFYIYGNNLLAIGISAFSSFFGLIFIAMYALNLKSMR